MPSPAQAYQSQLRPIWWPDGLLAGDGGSAESCWEEEGNWEEEGEHPPSGGQTLEKTQPWLPVMVAYRSTELDGKRELNSQWVETQTGCLVHFTCSSHTSHLRTWLPRPS